MLTDIPVAGLSGVPAGYSGEAALGDQAAWLQEQQFAAALRQIDPEPLRYLREAMERTVRGEVTMDEALAQLRTQAEAYLGHEIDSTA